MQEEVQQTEQGKHYEKPSLSAVQLFADQVLNSPCSGFDGCQTSPMQSSTP